MKSTRVVALLVLTLVASLFVPASSGAGLEVLAVGTYADQDVWRGQLNSEDPVLQHSVDIQYDDFNLNVFVNTDASGGEFGKIDEVNYDFNYSDFVPGTFDWKYVVGGIHYDYPTTDIPETTELYAGVGFGGFLNPAVVAYYDVVEADGLYIQAGLSETVQVLCLDVDLSATVGWGNCEYNQYYWNQDAYSGSHGSGSFQDLVLRAAIPSRINERTTIIPAITYTQLLDSDVRSYDTYGDDSSFLVGSVSALIQF